MYVLEHTMITIEWSYPTVPANPPAGFTAAANNSTAIQLTWSDPPTPYGIIVSYNISYNLSEVPVSVLVDAEDGNNYLVTGLNEHTVYSFEIFASTRVGPGPSARATIRTPDTSNYSCSHAARLQILIAEFKEVIMNMLSYFSSSL